MEQVGFVTSLKDGLAELDVRRTGACGADCSACSGTCDEKVEHIEIINSINAQVGDYVELRTDSKKVLSYIGLIYGFPLISFLLGTLLGNFLFGHWNLSQKELYAFLLGLVFLAISYGLISRYDKKSGVSYSPIEMVRILR